LTQACKAELVRVKLTVLACVAEIRLVYILALRQVSWNKKAIVVGKAVAEVWAGTQRRGVLPSTARLDVDIARRMRIVVFESNIYQNVIAEARS
jgi:hypothetical protein